MSNNTYISFYLTSFRIHIFNNVIAGIGSPKFIRFLLKEEGPSLLMEAYDKKDFHSHRVVKSTNKGLEINSFPLCSLLKNRLGWKSGQSYRVPGKVYPSQRIAVFDLLSAIQIQSN